MDPWVPPCDYQGVATDRELDEALTALAVVLDRYERARHAGAVEEAADRAIERWGEVLDRLR
jgi:hypothetical protein